MKKGDRAIFDGKDPFADGLNKRYGGDICTVLEVRAAPRKDCKVAFDSFPHCNGRNEFNWFYVPAICLTRIADERMANPNSCQRSFSR